ncbi:MULTISPECIES: DUF3015 family protein [Halobacteriovorax]|uniref:DUF3015 domain-containing protein n=1 Tax=Halobacteriovorax vibrionivorans TaxID=2152716 RepID=A0ABY0IE97_9BACT|nr:MULTISPECIES: DUF3015 family protein [Halobacteriovorax]RZF21266.1 DUF3015 domain-containing protein [Halobacteriovorax vibrionivorans]TGD47976.1 DUF3015 domain-containing protein [Halobacteriovorax sp. Y22]
MKKLLCAALFTVLTSTAFAAHGPAGCGLGAVIFEGKSGLALNALAGITNGIFSNQTFAMSTGTLKCEDAKTARVAAVSFVENNMIALSSDIAKGEGESLDAYLALINATNADKNILKSNFDLIFADNATAQMVHENIKSVLLI